MDGVRTFAIIVFLLFVGFTGYAMSVAEQSLIDFGIELMSSVDTAQVVIDLYIMAILACVWMYWDNKNRGRRWVRVLPYFAITLIFVSIGPLLYICINGFRVKRHAES